MARALNASAPLFIAAALIGGLSATGSIACSRAEAIGIDTAVAVVVPDTDKVIVPPVTPTTAPVNECATPKAGWIWCDDFESDRTSKYFEYNKAGGRFVRAAGVGQAGSFGMSAKYVTSSSDAGSLMLAFGKTPDSYIKPVDAGTAIYRDLYWRWYIMHPANWQGSGPDKMTRAISLVSAQWGEAVFAHVWDGENNDNRLLLDPASGTDVAGILRATTYNDFANMRWLGLVGSQSNIFDRAHLGKWLCIEAHAKLNDGLQSNGVFELWIDGVGEAQKTGLNWVGAYTAYGFNTILFENYWNNKTPVDQSRYWDNIVVSTQRVGC